MTEIRVSQETYLTLLRADGAAWTGTMRAYPNYRRTWFPLLSELVGD